MRAATKGVAWEGKWDSAEDATAEISPHWYVQAERKGPGKNCTAITKTKNLPMRGILKPGYRNDWQDNVKSWKDNIVNKWIMPRNWLRTSKRQGGFRVLLHSFLLLAGVASWAGQCKLQKNNGGLDFNTLCFSYCAHAASRLHRLRKLLHWNQQPRQALAPLKLGPICSHPCPGFTWCQDEVQGGEAKTKRKKSREKEEKKGGHCAIHACCL